MRKTFALACAAAVICCPPLLAGPVTWELHEGGRWDQLAPTTQATTSPSADLLLDAAERMVAAGQGKAGAKTGIQWLKAHPNKETPLRDRALFVVAQGLYVDSKRVDAFFYLDELMDEYPDSPYFHQALQKQYDMADEYLKGYRRVFIYWPVLGAEDEALDMLYRIQQRAPGSLLAEKALLRTADWYYATSEFDLAADAYAAYERSYPRSPYLSRVRLRRAYSNLAQFRSTWHDPTPLMDARAQLMDIVAAYPELAEQEAIPGLMVRMDEAFAEKIFRAADYYRRTDNPKAAVYYYRYLLAAFPTSPKVDEARERLAAMPKDALAQAAPRAGRGYAPATAPANPEER